MAATPPSRARVAVLAGLGRPLRGAWTVQVFHGLADPALAPRLLQRAAPWASLRRPKEDALRPRRRPGRYQQVNAPGPRWADLFEDALRGTEVSRHGHVALNEVPDVEPDRDGPLLWLPGPNVAALRRFAGDLAALARTVPVLAQVHARTPGTPAARKVRRMLSETRGVTLAPDSADPHTLLQGCRGLVAGLGSLGPEAYACGLPVALAVAPKARPEGLEAELAARAPALAPGDPALADWADAPQPPADRAWARDMLWEPRRSRNDAFAAELRQRAVAMAL